MKKRTLLTSLVLLAVFLAGAAAGAAVFQAVSADGGAPPFPVRRSDDRDEIRRQRGERGPVYALARLLHEELELTPDQERRVEEILDRRREEARAIFREVRGRFHEHLDATIAELKEPLTAEQAEEFQRLIDEMRERWRERERR